MDLTLQEQFIRGNSRIEVISNGGQPTLVPQSWRPVLKNSDVLVAIPDMHMFMHDSNLDNFKFGAEAMLDFLTFLYDLKEKLALKRKVLHVYQLGDLYELRFPHPTSGKPVTARDIRLSHPIYDAIIRKLTELRPHFIYGNHDFEHRHFSGFRSTAFDGNVYLEHGYEADHWYHFADPNKRFWQPAMSIFKQFRSMELSVHKLRVRMGHIRRNQHAAAWVTSGDVERGQYPDDSGYPSRQLRHFRKLMRGETYHANNVRVCVIGHTHHPYLDPTFANGRCIYIDAGAWTDGRTDFAVITNEEVAICRYRRAQTRTRIAHISAQSGQRTVRMPQLPNRQRNWPRIAAFSGN